MKIDNKFLKKSEIKQAINLLKQNKIVILPTDTIYGISAIYNQDNEKEINKLKKSSLNKKLITLISNFKQIKKFDIKLNRTLKGILKSNNPTTILFIIDEKSKKKIAIRMPKRKDLKKIINKAGPIFSTSVNISGEQYLETYDQLKEFNKNIEEIFYVGKLENRPSIIIDQNLKIIRE